MKIITDAKKVKAAAKAAGIKVVGVANHHFGEMWEAPCGRKFAWCQVSKKEASFGVAKKAWAFIAGDYERAY